jgi:hypothetical protein
VLIIEAFQTTIEIVCLDVGRAYFLSHRLVEVDDGWSGWRCLSGKCESGEKHCGLSVL